MQTSIQDEIQILVDQQARDRFAQEVNMNFSVIAPAGVGKTTAIVERILKIAHHCNINEINSKLSKLVVVTYTQKAAEEMRLRSYQALLKNEMGPAVINEFNKAFFGTIHSFCFNIIQSYGFYLGLPNNLALLINDRELWNEFISNYNSVVGLLPLNVKEGLYRHVNILQLLNLVREGRLNFKNRPDLSVLPKVDLTQILNYQPKKNSKKTHEIQKVFKLWWNEYLENPIGLEIPDVNQGEGEFKTLCAETFAELWHWLGDASLIFVSLLAEKYQEFRIQRGFITYDDIIDFAEKLLKVPDIIRDIKNKHYSVILDEAQDTDAQQFSVLLKVIPKDGDNNPLRGHFSMLGDPQQAIYSSRADLPSYLKIHQRLINSQAAEALTLNVTMRCDREIVRYCNAFFPSILKNDDKVSQIEFVPLNPRPWAQEGCVGKIIIPEPDEMNGKWSTSELEQYEAGILARKIQSLGLEGLDIDNWDEAAIIAPRKAWLIPIAKALKELGIPAQVHSHNETLGDNPAYAWLTALLEVVTSPNNAFEIVGVLRDIFGISDAKIADYAHVYKDSNVFSISNLREGEDSCENCSINGALRLLYFIRKECVTLSLSDAVHAIVDKIQLKNRLAVLPDYDIESLLDSLDNLLLKAALAEEEGLTLTEFTRDLKDHYSNAEGVETTLTGHVQLYTSHKAKGLEWSVVIVPFLFRSILFPAQAYPQVFSFGSEFDSKIAVTHHPDKVEWDILLNQYRVSELERLLYVTLTRTRNVLLIIDDEKLFKNSKNSFASLLQVENGNINRKTWNSLSNDCLIPKKENEKGNSKDLNFLQDISIDEIESPFDYNHITQARIHAANFFSPVLPHQLNKFSEQKNSDFNISFNPLQKPSKNYSPIDYGNWWHQLMRFLPWDGEKGDWKNYFNRQIHSSPDAGRSKFEFDLFLNSLFISDLLKKEIIIRTEFPFSFKTEMGIYYQGIIDFVAYLPNENAYLIIDWKTDLFECNNNTDDMLAILLALKESYGPQIILYRDIIQKMEKKEVISVIYSTSLGQIITC